MEAVLWVALGIIVLVFWFLPADADQAGRIDGDPNHENDFVPSTGYDPAHFAGKALEEVNALGGAGY